MGRLILARHGQASFLSDNYDQLSALGVRQAYRLGEYWAGRNTLLDRAISGPQERQKDTAAEAAKACWREGLKFPKPEVFPEFAEYDGDAIMRLGLPLLLEREPRMRRLHAAFQAATGKEQRHAAFQRVFEVVQGAWARGEIADRSLESWADFSVRVNAGFDRVINECRPAATIVVFTSGGPIALAMQRALQLSVDLTLRTSWMSRNASWSEFLFSREHPDRFTLSTFNDFSHLGDPTMHTYR